MILIKHLTAREVLETLAELALTTVPENMQGTINLTFDEENGVEIYFIPNNEETLTH